MLKAIVCALSLSTGAASSAGERSAADGLQGVAALGGAVLTTGDAVGGVLSGGFGIQLRPGVALAELSLGGDSAGLLDLSAAASLGLRGTGRLAPYALAGVGYWARGWFDTAGREVVAGTGEVGVIVPVSPLEIWVGARAYVPLATTASFKGSLGHVPDSIRAVLTVRVVAAVF